MDDKGASAEGQSDLLNAFNVATFKGDDDEPAFWDRLIPAGERVKDEAEEPELLGLRATRMRGFQEVCFCSFSESGDQGSAVQLQDPAPDEEVSDCTALDIRTMHWQLSQSLNSKPRSLTVSIRCALASQLAGQPLMLPVLHRRLAHGGEMAQRMAHRLQARTGPSALRL